MTYISYQSATSHHAPKLIYHCVLTVFPAQTEIYLQLLYDRDVTDVVGVQASRPESDGCYVYG